MVNGVLWRLRTGAPWRDLPERYGPWQTVYERFARWEVDGTWAKLLEHVQVHDDARGGRVEWIVAVDSTINRARQHAAGARKRGTQTATNRKIRAARRRIRHSVVPGAG
ncbi:transposase [Streptomyces sp. Tue 6075]|nr:transposase [Streptomyces sp. Tue 6075]